VAVALVGLVLASGLGRSGTLAEVVGVIGLFVALAALGVVELAMAIWNRARHRRRGTGPPGTA
jgi:hypothetical protein